MKIALSVAILSFSCAAAGIAADFDGDGVADKLETIRDAAKAAAAPGVQLVNPWHESSSKQKPKGFAIRIRLSRAPQIYLLHDHDFFGGSFWMESKPPVKVITKRDPQYKAWKKHAPGLQGDAIELGTEAGIDILLYWNGKEWCTYSPPDEA